MAKKKPAASKSQGQAWSRRLAGQSFAFGGKIWQLDAYKEIIADEGGQVADAITAGLTYLVLGHARGTTAQEKLATKLNQKQGAAIQIVDTAGFLALFSPSADEALAMLRGGPDALAHWQRIARLQVPATDLSGSNLRDLKLGNASACLENLIVDNANFSGADLSTAELPEVTGAKFDGADLTQASVLKSTDASFRQANLTEASFGEQITGCDFTKAKMQRFAGHHGHISRCNFAGADLKDAKLNNSQFADCDFAGAGLQQAMMSNCEFKDTSFARADLTGADLTGAKLCGADLTGAILIDVSLRDADLTGAKIDGADFTGAQTAGAKLDGLKVAKAKGLSLVQPAASVAGPNLKALSAQAKKADRLDIHVTLDLPDGYVQIQVWSNRWGCSTHYTQFRGDQCVPGGHTQQKSLGDYLLFFGHRYRDAAVRVDSLKVVAQKAALGGKELKKLVLAAWFEALGKPVPTDEDLKNQRSTKKQDEAQAREQALAELRQGAKGVKKWNARPHRDRERAGSFRQVDLSNADLAGVDMQGLDLQEAKFDGANLTGARLDFTTLAGASFQGANLEAANLAGNKGAEANLSHARMKAAILRGRNWKRANFANADLTNADVTYADVSGADLSGSKLDGANFEQVKFDEATRFPKGFTLPPSMRWAGKGVDPRIAKVIAKKPRGPIDVDNFMERIEENTEAAKLQKALSMLKADRFKLYAQVAEDHLVGVVKSQGDPDLVYSCRLNADGSYACCTQNLNICGGLRGSLCKHLLVLIIGLAKGKEVELAGVDRWIAASRLQKPALDKDAMSETFLRYKGAEAGEVDWRPTETIPEDYYAM